MFDADQILTDAIMNAIYCEMPSTRGFIFTKK